MKRIVTTAAGSAQPLPSHPLGPLGTLATNGTQEGEGQGWGLLRLKFRAKYTVGTAASAAEAPEGWPEHRQG